MVIRVRLVGVAPVSAVNLWFEFRRQATNTLLEEKNCDEQAEELAGEPGKRVDVFARVDGSEDDNEQCRPVQGGCCKRTERDCRVRVLAEFVHKDVNENDWFSNAHNQERLAAKQGLEETANGSWQKHLRTAQFAVGMVRNLLAKRKSRDDRGKENVRCRRKQAD